MKHIKTIFAFLLVTAFSFTSLSAYAASNAHGAGKELNNEEVYIPDSDAGRIALGRLSKKYPEREGLFSRNEIAIEMYNISVENRVYKELAAYYNIQADDTGMLSRLEENKGYERYNHAYNAFTEIFQTGKLSASLSRDAAITIANSLRLPIHYGTDYEGRIEPKGKIRHFVSIADMKNKLKNSKLDTGSVFRLKGDSEAQPFKYGIFTRYNKEKKPLFLWYTPSNLPK